MSDPNSEIFPLRNQEQVYYHIPASEEGTESVCRAYGITPDLDEFLAAIRYITEDEGSDARVTLGHVMDAAEIATADNHSIPLSAIPSRMRERMYNLGKTHRGQE